MIIDKTMTNLDRPNSYWDVMVGLEAPNEKSLRIVKFGPRRITKYEIG